MNNMKPAAKKPSDENGKSKLQEDPANRRSTDYRPSPLDFLEFMPWTCLQFQCSDTVTVTRILLDDFMKAANRRTSVKSAKSAKGKATDSQEEIPSIEHGFTSPADDSIQIKAHYNSQGQLQEVAIVGSPFEISRTVIQVFGLAVPYHPYLSKLTISRGGLTATGIVEIGKLLQRSYLTDICLDDTDIPQKNYTTLLEIGSRLKHLSLNRCQLGDETCMEIATSMGVGTPGSMLRTLELSSNRISDKGALAIANMLRRNRQLVHLNLSGNHITDKGGSAILNILVEFLMSKDEVFDMKRNCLKYNRKKIAIYDQLLLNIKISRQRAEVRSKSSSRSKALGSATYRHAGGSKPKSPTPKKNSNKKYQGTTPDSTNISGVDGTKIGQLSAATRKARYSHPDLELKAKETVGEFEDPFDTAQTILRDGYFYCVGNLFLCSLNLAYNNLEYSTIRLINSVLEYQSTVDKPPGATGLMRITFDGNLIPKHCAEYVEIETLLQNIISVRMPVTTTKKKGPGQRKSAGAIHGLEKISAKA